MYFNQRQSAYKMINKCGGVYIQQQFSEGDLMMIRWCTLMPDRVVGGQRIGFNSCFHLGPESSVKQVLYYLSQWSGEGGGGGGTGLALVRVHFKLDQVQLQVYFAWIQDRDANTVWAVGSTGIKAAFATGYQARRPLMY